MGTLFEIFHNGERFEMTALNREDAKKHLMFIEGVSELPDSTTIKESTHRQYPVTPDEAFKHTTQSVSQVVMAKTAKVVDAFDWNKVIEMYEKDTAAALSMVMEEYNVGRTQAILMISEKY